LEIGAQTSQPSHLQILKCLRIQFRNLDCKGNSAKLSLTAVALRMAQACRPSRGSEVLGFADFKVDLRIGELHRNGTTLRLQEQPFQVLALLTSHAGEVVSREQLRRHLWPSDTFVDFDNSLNTAINKVREALGDSTEDPRFIETLPRRGYRFIAPVEELSNNNRPILRPQTASDITVARYPRGRILLGALFLALALSAAGYWAKHRSGHRLAEKDTIVLADFTNSTGDPVFDDTLKRALEVQLRQSPFLSLVPDQQVRETLHFMGRSPADRVAGSVAQEVCEREGAKAMLQGSIKSLGSHYILDLNALNCKTGESLAADQAEVTSKEQVLAALGSMASRLRGRLGESLTFVEKYDTPVLQATTPSLEALKAYSKGATEEEKLNAAGAIPLFEQAIELDPNFALAYIGQATAYGDLGEDELARASVRKAFALRERVSEREKLSISAFYHEVVTGDLARIFEADRLWENLYPRESFPHNSLAYHYNVIGVFDKALEESTIAVRVAPHSASGHLSLASAYFGMNRWQESRTALQPVIIQGEGDFATYCFLYVAALAQGDEAAMHTYLEGAKLRLQEGEAARLQFTQAEVAAFHGKFRIARELSERSTQAAEQVGLKQNVGAMAGQQALWEAEIGNRQAASERARQALGKNNGIDVAVNAAVALAIAGDARSAERMADNLARSHTEDTVLNAVSVPLIRSTIALERNRAHKTIELLRVSEPYELGFGFLYYPPFVPTYVRGQAYLKLRDGSRAAIEFQKILAHRGLDPVSPSYALAHLGLGRARALTGDVAAAKAAYQNFLSLWEDADPDIPILRQAKEEYAKLQ